MADNNYDLLLEKINNMHDDVIEIKRDVKKQNGRVRRLEDWRNYLVGGGAVCSVIGGILWKLL